MSHCSALVIFCNNAEAKPPLLTLPNQSVTHESSCCPQGALEMNMTLSYFVAALQAGLVTFLRSLKMQLMGKISKKYHLGGINFKGGSNVNDFTKTPVLYT